MAVKHMPYSLFLDSADPKHPASRYSYVMCMPVETIEAKGSDVTVTNWDQRLTLNGNPLDILEDRLSSWMEKTKPIKNLPPFQGGAAGLFSYDLCRYLENIPEIPKAEKNVPDMAIGIYDQVISFDSLTKKTHILTHARNEQEAAKKRTHLINLVTKKIDAPKYKPQNPPLKWSSNFDKKGYCRAVQKVIDYIYAGDIFQANIAQSFKAPKPQGFDPFIHYLHMRKCNPAPFACYMNIDDIKISSTSPERFINVKNGIIETCPIKGTRARSENAAQDQACKTELLKSAKDRAENTMIVDLLRNDLAKISTPDSVEVKELCSLETFASVHHLVSTIRAKLEKHYGPVDILRACFPGGSISGAPKIRAMEIINEIENLYRGAYCGSMGYIGFDGCMDTNILIRTLTFDKNNIILQSGAGIVADSEPEKEYQETLDKASAIIKSF